MSKHTLTPWIYEVNKDGNNFKLIVPYRDDDDVILEGFFTNHSKNNHEANALRIVTCVNAMEGLTNEEVINLRKDTDQEKEKVAVSFAEWMNEPVEKYSHGCLLRATPQKPDYKTYYLRIEGQSFNSNTVFYTLPELYQYFIENIYNK